MEEYTREELDVVKEMLETIPDEIIGIIYKYSFDKGYQSALNDTSEKLKKEHEIGYLEGYKSCMSKVFEMLSNTNRLTKDFLVKTMKELGIDDDEITEEMMKGMN